MSHALSQDCWTLTARWIFPVDQPPLEEATITIGNDRILRIEPQGSKKADVDLGDAAILPGLVNAHTHLDLTGARGQLQPCIKFTDWLRQVIAYRRGREPQEVQGDIRAGLEESLRHGTTLVGDIAADGGSWQILARSPIRAVVFRELLGLSEERAAAALEGLTRWLTGLAESSTCRAGISPHAPYSVRSTLFLAAATQDLFPVSIHLAETAEELLLLKAHSGPFVDFLEELGMWVPDGLADNSEHILQLTSGLAPMLYIHCNYLPPDAPVPRNGTIVYCPRTHAAFGHPPHPFREFLARGVRVALGTDSLASNPDLDLLAEVRFIHQKHPEVAGAALLRMATLSGAEALGWATEAGSLTPGKSADLVVIPISSATLGDPHQLILETSQRVQKVLYRGQWVVPKS